MIATPPWAGHLVLGILVSVCVLECPCIRLESSRALIRQGERSLQRRQRLACVNEYFPVLSICSVLSSNIVCLMTTSFTTPFLWEIDEVKLPGSASPLSKSGTVVPWHSIRTCPLMLLLCWEDRSQGTSARIPVQSQLSCQCHHYLVPG